MLFLENTKNEDPKVFQYFKPYRRIACVILRNFDLKTVQGNKGQGVKSMPDNYWKHSSLTECFLTTWDLKLNKPISEPPFLTCQIEILLPIIVKIILKTKWNVEEPWETVRNIADGAKRGWEWQFRHQRNSFLWQMAIV